MTRADLIAGLLLAGGFGGVVWEASSFQYGTEFAPGPGFAPVWLGVIGIILSLIIAGNAWRAARVPRDPSADDLDALDRPGLVRVGAALVGLVAMVMVVPWLGLALSIFAFLLFLTLGVQRLPIAMGVGASVATVVFIYLVFVHFLGVPIPSGPLGI